MDGEPSVGRIEPPKTALQTTRASDIEPQPIQWLWPQRFALGKLSLIAGDPGLGKSQLTLDMAARVSQGTTWPADGTDAPQGGVLIVSAEDDAKDTIVPRLMAAGADLQHIRIAELVIDYGTETPIERELLIDRDVKLIEHEIMAMGNCRLVIVDPISAYMGRTDTHNNADVRAILLPLSKLAQRCNVAVIAVSHLNKAAGGNANYRVSGSIAFTAAARAVYVVTKDQDDPKRRLMVCVKNNLGDDETGLAYRIETKANGVPYLDWEDEIIEIPAEDALNPDIEDKRGARDEAKEFLHDFLEHGPAKAQDVLKAARSVGINDSTLRRAKKDLGVHSGKRGFTKGWHWSLYPLKPEDDQKPLRESVVTFEKTDHLRGVMIEATQGLPMSADDALKLFNDSDRRQIENGELPTEAVRHVIKTTLAEQAYVRT